MICYKPVCLGFRVLGFREFEGSRILTGLRVSKVDGFFVSLTYRLCTFEPWSKHLVSPSMTPMQSPIKSPI